MRAIACVAVIVLAAGCPPAPSPSYGTPGTYGRLDFYWPGSPLAAGGAHVPLHVARPSDGMPAAFARVDSTHPEVATATPFENGLENVAVFTAAAGTTEIRVYDDADALLDSIELTVRAAANIDIRGADSPVTVLANTILHVHLQPVDDNGVPLYGFFAVRAEFTGLAELPAREHDSLPMLDFAFTPTAPTAEVLFTSDSIARAISLRSVTLDDLTDLQLTEQDGPGFQIVSAKVLAGSAAVLNALCNWTTSDGDVRPAPPVPEGWLDFSGSNTYYVPRRDHSLVVTCTVGPLSSSVSVPPPK